ncbi:hypothetical protein K6V92_02255 [Cupriavidus respiraculi]|uniref:hypothetical protein n=1 Tax=Cupriavidus respiraculi TaxID=195930 RepID=UPI001C964846|nr:hypothetical protein [Cupriavidus respiraculi]MBY4945444.1 hypothetical protein [Cupriavidus respiraculi]
MRTIQQWSLAMAMAGAVAGCGGDRDRNEPAPVPPETAPAQRTVAVQPHLGSVANAPVWVTNLSGVLLGQGTVGSDGLAAIVLTPPANTDPCGPAFITVGGADSATYFNEATGLREALPSSFRMQTVAPDVCGIQAPVSVSPLDEIALGLANEKAVRLQELHARQEEAMAAHREEAAALRQQISDLIAQVMGENRLVIAGVLGLTGGAGMLAPTPIGAPVTHLPSTAAGEAAAVLHAMAQARQKMARLSAPLSNSPMVPTSISEWTPKLVEMQVALLIQAMQSQNTGTADRQSLLALAGRLEAGQYLAKAGPSLAAANIGSSIKGIVDDSNALMLATMDNPPDLAARAAGAAALEPVASMDLGAVMRGAMAPLLLRTEPASRWEAALAQGHVEYTCAVGALSQGKVAIDYLDMDNSGTLNNGDRFDIAYDNCLTADPLAGLTVARQGTMQVVHHAADPGAPVPDVRGHVTFDVVFNAPHAEGTMPSMLFAARGSWIDRLAFANPGDTGTPLTPGAAPAVMVQSSYFEIMQAGNYIMTQGISARLDTTPGFGGGTATGSAALDVSGMSGGVVFDTATPMVFTATPTSGATLTSGGLEYHREFGVPGSGTLGIGTAGTIRTALTDSAGTTTVRALPLTTLLTAYLTR